MSARNLRLALALSAIAVCQPARATLIVSIWPMTFSAPSQPAVFSFSTAPGHELSVLYDQSTSQIIDFGPQDTPEIAALTADLTNRPDNTFTISYNGTTIVKPESLFSPVQPNPYNQDPQVEWYGALYAYLDSFNGAPYRHIDAYRLWIGKGGPATAHGTFAEFTIYGGVPEPATWVLAVMAVVEAVTLIKSPASAARAKDELAEFDRIVAGKQQLPPPFKPTTSITRMAPLSMLAVVLSVIAIGLSLYSLPANNPAALLPIAQPTEDTTKQETAELRKRLTKTESQLATQEEVIIELGFYIDSLQRDVYGGLDGHPSASNHAMFRLHEDQ